MDLGAAPRNVVGTSAKIDEGVVIAPKATLRSSTAKVALPIAEFADICAPRRPMIPGIGVARGE